MSTITADLAGQQLTVDLGRITAWDAYAFRVELGQDLEATIAEMAVRGAPVTIVELAVVAWLWFRQTTTPDASFRAVASTLLIFPDEDPPADQTAPAGAEPDGPGDSGAAQVRFAEASG